MARGVFVTLGSKFERNEFTGVEIQPTMRARWSTPRRSAVGRRVERDARADPLRYRPSLSFPGSTTGACC